MAKFVGVPILKLVATHVLGGFPDVPAVADQVKVVAAPEAIEVEAADKETTTAYGSITLTVTLLETASLYALLQENVYVREAVSAPVDTEPLYAPPVLKLVGVQLVGPFVADQVKVVEAPEAIVLEAADKETTGDRLTVPLTTV